MASGSSDTATTSIERARSLRASDANTSSSPTFVDPTHAVTNTLRVVRIIAPPRSSTNFHKRRTPPTPAGGDGTVQYGGIGCGSSAPAAARTVCTSGKVDTRGSLPLRSAVSSFPPDRCRRSVCGGHTLRRSLGAPLQERAPAGMLQVGMRGVDLLGSAFWRVCTNSVVGSPVATISSTTHPCSMARRPHE